MALALARSDKVFKTFDKYCKDRAAETLRALPKHPSGAASGHLVLAALEKDYGITDQGEIDDMICALRNGDVKQAGHRLQGSANMIVFLNNFQILRQQAFDATYLPFHPN